MAGIHITDIEAAINYWRERSPSSDAAMPLTLPLRALAEVYALMVYHRQTEADETTMPAAARQAWLVLGSIAVLLYSLFFLLRSVA